MKIREEKDQLVMIDDDWQMVLKKKGEDVLVVIGEANGMSQATFIAPYEVVKAWFA